MNLQSMDLFRMSNSDEFDGLLWNASNTEKTLIVDHNRDFIILKLVSLELLTRLLVYCQNKRCIQNFCSMQMLGSHIKLLHRVEREFGLVWFSDEKNP